MTVETFNRLITPVEIPFKEPRDDSSHRWHKVDDRYYAGAYLTGLEIQAPVNEASGDIRAFHSSKQKIDKFDNSKRTELSSFGFHFGTKDQAQFRTTQFDFGSKSPFIGEYSLDIKNPLEVSHMESFSPEWLADKMELEGILDLSEFEQFQEDEFFPSDVELGDFLVKKLKDAGYDGLKYENEREGEGYSYVPFDTSQIIEIGKQKAQSSSEK